MSSSLVRRVAGVVDKPPQGSKPSVTVLATPARAWSVGKYLKRLASVWVASWVAIVVVCLVAAAHKVPFRDDAVAATLLASLITAAAASDLTRSNKRDLGAR